MSPPEERPPGKTIFKLKAAQGEGFLRDWWLDRPIITGRESEAEQFATHEEAEAVRLKIVALKDRLPMVVVEREAHERYEHGRP